MRRRTRFAGILAISSLSALPMHPLAEGTGPVGVVDDLQGAAAVIHPGASVGEPLAIESPILHNDIIKTEEASQIRLVFVDDTVVTLGADSILKVTKYVYSPEQAERTSVLTVPEGFFRVLVRKLLPDSVFEVRTMSAVAAVRATEWMGEATSAKTAIVVLDGAVSVKSSNPTIEGEVILGRGDGIDLELDEAPESPRVWGQARIIRFKQRTSLHGD